MRADLADSRDRVARPLGTVRSLWRYPVKSLLGEAGETLELNERGAVGDRIYAIRDANGKFGSGKNTRRFRHIDGLFRFRARSRAAGVEIQFPDGWVMGVEEPGVHDALSSWLGQPVTVAREADVSFFDQEPIHLITTASLAWMQAALPAAAIDERRFRPNLLIDAPGASPIERDWIGRTLGVGSHVRLRVERTAERCGMIAFGQADLPRDAAVLRYVEDVCDMQFGVYAKVLVPGTIRLGEAVTFGD